MTEKHSGAEPPRVQCCDTDKDRRIRELEARVAELEEALHLGRAERTAVERSATPRLVEVSATQVRAILDNSTAVIFIKDLQGRYLLANRRYCELFHVTPTTVIGKTDRDIFPEEFAREFTEADRRVLEARRSIEVEEVVPHEDGVHHYISIKFPLFGPDGNPCAVGGIATDITDRKRIEQQLRESDQRKDDFLAMLSHELRNPLAPIRNSLYILDRVPPGSEQARRAQRVIDRQTAHMTRLIDDLLDVTRISRGKMSLARHRLELCDLVRRTVEDHRALFAQSGVTLDVHVDADDLWVNGDATRLAQVTGNLLQNAAKFAGKGGTTSVVVERDGSGGVAVLRVRDTGVGVSADMVPLLFEPFVQADRSLDRSRGGLGLGLALAKGIVELHGGTVGASSEGLGAGAEFTVRLPLEPPAAEVPPVRASQLGSPQRSRVLVIEDNVDAAESLKEALQLGDHDVAVAHTGPEGIEMARAFEPDVVLCDIGLPGMDGYQVARAFRADAALERVSLVALTGYAGPKDRELAAAAGFERHLAKPPSIETLEELLANVRRR